MQLQALKAQIGRSDYHVDPDAVAEALILRMLDARAATGRGMTLADSGDGCSGDVLEAG